MPLPDASPPILPCVHAGRVDLPTFEPTMRKAATALCLSTVFLSACASRSSNGEESNPIEAPDTNQDSSTAGDETSVDPSEVAADQLDRLSLQEQRKRFLVEQHVENAQNLLDQGMQSIQFGEPIWARRSSSTPTTSSSSACCARWAR